MTDKTPKRPINSPSSGFSPVTLSESPAAASPQKNLTGLPRVVRDLVADVYNSIQRWNDAHIKGATLVKELASLKSDNLKDFSPNLEKLISNLYMLVQEMKQCKSALVGFGTQMRASEKLQRNPQLLFISLDVNALSNLVEEISSAYEAEYEVKEFVLENITYSKNSDEAMFLAALWTYQYKITDKTVLKLETLLVETGHRKTV